MINAQRFTNVGDYLRDFLRALNREAATEGAATYEIEVRDDGLKESDVALLR